MNIDPLLKVALKNKASDLFLTVGFPPSAKINGKLQPLSKSKLNHQQVLALIEGMMSEQVKLQFHQHKEANFAISREEVGRFRVSAFWQREHPGVVIRRIETTIPKLDDLALPEVLKDLSLTKRGLIVLVGGTGTGKSTSLAAMVGHRNAHSYGHILTIEDPIEFVHEHKNCIVNQREVGLDTESFEEALKSSLRQAPDVILIGEIRTQETMEFALSFAETGHLCMATLHANNANQALERIMHLVPEERHRQLFFDMSMNLKAIVAQQLIPSKDGKSRHAAIEVLVNSPRVSDIIAKGELHELKATMAKSDNYGMQTFDQALYKLIKEDKISEEEAMHHADSANDLRLMLKLDGTNNNDYSNMDNVTLDFGDDS